MKVIYGCIKTLSGRILPLNHGQVSLELLELEMAVKWEFLQL